MDQQGNTVFQNPDAQPQPPVIPPQPSSESVVPFVPVPPPPSGLPPTPTSFLPKILKIVSGILIFLLLIFIVFNFIVPRFFEQKKENVTLTYWGLWEDSTIVKPVIDDFERENPNIKISYSKQDPKQYRQRLMTRIQNGSGPDVFRFHNTWFPMLSKVLLPLPSDTVTKKEFQENYYPVVNNDLIKDGAIYGIPLQIDTLALFVNQEIFQAAGASVPVSWDEFIRVSRGLTVKDEEGRIKTSGAAMGTFDNITHAPDIISLLFVQNGVLLNDFSSNPAGISDSLDFYTSFATGDSNIWDNTLDNSILAFSKGNLAMYLGYSWDIFTIKALNPNLNFTIHPVPRLAGKGTTIASYWVEGVSVKSKNQKEALLFLKFLAEKETAQKLYSQESKTRLFGEPYPRKDLADSLKDNSLIYPFVLQANDATSSFFASDTSDEGLNSQMNTYLGDAVRSILDNTSPQTATETLIKGVDQVLGQYGK